MCVRADKNSEFSKTSKMKLLDKTFNIFKYTIFGTTFILDVGFNSKTFKMKLSGKTAKIFIKALTIFAITFISDARV